MSPYCENCQERCSELRECPECLGTGLFQGMFIGGQGPNYFGLKNPSQLPCRICDGKGVIEIFCPYYE